MIYTINIHTTVYQFWRFVYHHEQSVIDNYARITLYTLSLCTKIRLHAYHLSWPQMYKMYSLLIICMYSMTLLRWQSKTRSNIRRVSGGYPGLVLGLRLFLASFCNYYWFVTKKPTNYWRISNRVSTPGIQTVGSRRISGIFPGNLDSPVNIRQFSAKNPVNIRRHPDIDFSFVGRGNAALHFNGCKIL